MFSFLKIKKNNKENNPNNKIITRIPPSPTGNLHVGTARTALFNYLFTKKYGGKILLRMEDTDKERSTKEFEKNIIEGLKWLGINWDNEEIIRQSERTDLYKSYLNKMIKEGSAYVSKESEIPAQGGDDGGFGGRNDSVDNKVSQEKKRSEVIRFKNPNKVITFEDKVRGEISFDTTELGDFVIAKSLDEPIYHFAVVVDDYEMKITHIIRGEDHISNTQRQILIQEAIGASRPIYAHLPLLLGKDKSKLSKRHGATAISSYKEEGYLPEALINYLALLGWNPGTEQEIFTMEELISLFDLEKIQKGGAIFDKEKLDWFNREHLKKIPKHVIETQIIQKIGNKLRQKELEKVVPMILERINKLNDVDEIINKEFSFFINKPEYEKEKLLWKDSKDLDEVKTHLEFIKNKFNTLSADGFSHDIIKESIWDYASDKGRGNVLWPLRYALSGQEKSPDPFEIADILGKEETIFRIDTAIEKIG